MCCCVGRVVEAYVKGVLGCVSHFWPIYEGCLAQAGFVGNKVGRLLLWQWVFPRALGPPVSSYLSFLLTTVPLSSLLLLSLPPPLPTMQGGKALLVNIETQLAAFSARQVGWGTVTWYIMKCALMIGTLMCTGMILFHGVGLIC